MAVILTKAQLNHLLDVYETQGSDAARKLAPQYGVKPTYVKKLASVHKVRAKRQGANPRWQKRIPQHLDPRWERARSIGPVVA